MKTGVFDIKGKELKIGDKVRYWSFYHSQMSSEYCFGTEPQNSFQVYEEYMEQLTGEVVFYLGAFCIKHHNGIFSFKEIIENTSGEVIHYFLCGSGGSIEQMFDDYEFWGDSFSEKLNGNMEQEDWDLIANYIKQKCKEFELI